MLIEKSNSKSHIIDGNSSLVGLKTKVKKGTVFIRCSKRNVFCTLMDTLDKKVKTSCSMRVPAYENEYNERENPYTRGLLLGNMFGNKTSELGYNDLTIYLGAGINKGRRGVVRGLGQKGIKISLIQLGTGYPHNGCRPSKVRRKKFRTKPKISR
uniref:Ribosomal protein S11 n=1 Tax=Akkesiphycus lubricus TaxID=3022 RepID=A0A8F0FBN4_AKKLU|nr:ribosomal protein S11 [Akkesiphycus lubricus]